jgi:hypothetical protein
MCIIISKKCKLKNTKKERWFLYKVRDRNYDPEYKVEIKKRNGVEALFLLDQESGWREGINNKNLMLVSSALDNHSDFDTNGRSKKTKDSIARTDFQHKLLETSLLQTNINKVTKILSDGLFQGTTFISNGDDLTIMEIYLKPTSYDRELKKFQDAQGKEAVEKLTIAEQTDIVMKGVTRDDYDIKIQPIKKDKLVIRTNHGKLIKHAGYQPSDEETQGWESSTKRYNYTWDAVEKLEDPHPMDILSVVSNLTDKDPVDQNNPIRPQEKLDPKDRIEDAPIFKYYTSSIVMLSNTGKLFLVPVKSSVDNSRLDIKDEREVDLIILPRNMALFEGHFRELMLDSIKNEMIQR